MSAPKIPPRNPIGDNFEGVVLQDDDVFLLGRTPQNGAQTVKSGMFVIRYGVVYLGKPHLSIVPGLLALDYGQFLTGENAWHFLFNKSNLYPRADVLGYRNDGEDDMVVVKSLDLMHPLDILVYEDDEAAKPLAQARALIAAATEGLPPRLLEYATIYPSLDAWQQAQL